MRSDHDTEPGFPPAAPGETDPAYPPANGDRPSNGLLGKNGVKAHVGPTDPGPGTPTPARRNDSIDELIEGLPEEASLPRKRTRATSGQDAARWDAQGRPVAGISGGPELPAVIPPPETTSPPVRRKRKMDAPTFVTPQGHDLQTRRRIALGVAVCAVVGIVVVALKWSSTTDIPVKPGMANTSPTEAMTSKSLGMPIATTTPTTPTTTGGTSAAGPALSSVASGAPGSSSMSPRSNSSSPRATPKGSDSRIEHDYRLDR
jgi:hypothetical protein